MYKIPFLLLLLSSFAYSQFAVVSTQPVNNATSVPLTTTISMTFNEALDTNSINDLGGGSWFSNTDSMISYGYSGDLKTTFGTYVLEPNTVYFVAFTYVKALSGAVITTPHVFYFTTGSAFPTSTVSGTVHSGSTGVSPEKAIVGLMSHSIEETEGEPSFTAWANVNSNGTFTIPYVANGTYWPIAAKDADGDGEINPDKGADVIAFGDSIVVNNGSVTNYNLTFISFAPLTYHQAVSIADSIADLHLPADRVLRYVNTWGVDTLGRGIGSWHFNYTGRGNTVVYDVPGSQFEGGVDSNFDAGHISWVASHKPITNHALAVSSPAVITNIENEGGLAFRRQAVPLGAEFSIEMTLGGHTTGEFFEQVPDTSKIYWSVRYIWEINQEPWMLDGRKFLCDFTTGAVLLTGTMSVEQEIKAPLSFELFQNYPNPFNPTTAISFTVPSHGHAVLTVYNMLGQEVAALFNGEAVSGRFNTVQFNASEFASGLYFARLTFNGNQMMKKMMLVK